MTFTLETPGLAELPDQAIRAYGSAIVVAADQVGIVPLLARYPRGLDAAEIAHKLGLNAMLAQVVLPALAQLGVLTEIDNRYMATELAIQHLDSAREAGYCGHWLRLMHAEHWVRTGMLGDYLAGKIALGDTLFEAADNEVLTKVLLASERINAAAGSAFS